MHTIRIRRGTTVSSLRAQIDDRARQSVDSLVFEGPSLFSDSRIHLSVEHARSIGIGHFEIVTDLGAAISTGDIDWWSNAAPDRAILHLSETSESVSSDSLKAGLLVSITACGTKIVLTHWMSADAINALVPSCRLLREAGVVIDELRLGLTDEVDGLGFGEIADALFSLAGIPGGCPSIRLLPRSGIPVCALPIPKCIPKLDPALEAVADIECGSCAIRRRCPGLPSSRRQSLSSSLKPFRSVPPQMLGPMDEIPDLSPAVRIGKYNRLKQHGTMSSLRRQKATWPPDVPVYVSRAEYDDLDTDLAGMRAVLARMPVARPFEGFQPLTLAPLAPIVLANVLRSRGADVLVRDLAVQSRRTFSSAELELLGDGAGWSAHLSGMGDAARVALLDRLVHLLDVGNVDLAGFSVECDADKPLAIALGKELASRTGARVVVGGRILGDAGSLALLWPGCFFVMHEGEVPLLMLADALMHGNPLGEIPSLGFTKDGEFCNEGRMAIHDLDILPVLDLTGVPLDGYDQGIVEEGEGPVLPYLFNKGCPHVCGYCGDSTRRIVRLRSPDLIVADLESAALRFGVRRFYFLDHLLNADRRHFAELLDRLERQKLDIVWVDSCKAVGMDRDTLLRLRKVGASMLSWGIDVGSRRMARLMRKGIDLDEAADILHRSHDAGIKNHVNLIIGMPHETDEDIEETVRYVDRIRHWVDRFRVAKYRYYGNSLLSAHPESYGLAASVGGEGVDVPGGATWEEHCRVADAHLATVREAAWGRAGLSLL